VGFGWYEIFFDYAHPKKLHNAATCLEYDFPTGYTTHASVARTWLLQALLNLPDSKKAAIASRNIRQAGPEW